jgi:hypothetical protein
MYISNDPSVKAHYDHDKTLVALAIGPYTTHTAAVASTLLTSFKLPVWSITTEKSQDIIYGYPLFFLIGFDNSWQFETGQQR